MNVTTPTELTKALDSAYASLVKLDCKLVAAGLKDWQPPRSHALTAFGELHHLRDALRELVGQLPHRQTVVDAPQAPCPKTPGPSERPQDTSDDDRGASILNRPHKGTTTATAQPQRPQRPRDTELTPIHSRTDDARRGAHTTL